jgi:hypothetical protein
MGTPLQTTALYRRLGRRSRLPTVYLTRPSYLQRLLSLFSL